jgi:hypothetical protein
MAMTSTSRLPELSSLLDPGSLRSRLAPIRDRRAALVGAAPFHLRWSAGRSALLGVRLGWHTKARVEETLAALYLGGGIGEAAESAATLQLIEPALGPAMARLDDALFLAYPNDRALKGLAVLADARRVLRRLAELAATPPWGDRRASREGSRVRPVRWEPGRRAVLALELAFEPMLERIPDPARGADESGESADWKAHVRVWPVTDFAAQLERWKTAAELPALGVPRVQMVDVERGWFATSVAPGRALAAVGAVVPAGTPLAGGTSGSSFPGEALERALGEAFVTIHASSGKRLAVREDWMDLATAERALRSLSGFAPDLSARASALAMRFASGLRTLAPIDRVFTHGSMGADKLHLRAGRVTVDDWDEATNGDPHADWASLLADVRGRGMASEWVAPLASRALGGRFDRTRFAWQHAVAETRAAVEDLQRGRAGWRTRALDSLAAAERALGSVPAAPARRRVDIARQC